MRKEKKLGAVHSFVTWPCVLIVFCLFVILVISRFGFDGGVWFLIAPVLIHCLLVTFIKHSDNKKYIEIQFV